MQVHGDHDHDGDPDGNDDDNDKELGIILTVMMTIQLLEYPMSPCTRLCMSQKTPMAISREPREVS